MYGTLKVIVTDRYIIISLFVLYNDIYRSRLLEYFSFSRNKNSQFHFIDDHYLKESNHVLI